MRPEIPPRNVEIAEEIIPVGNLISEALYAREQSDKCFIMQAGNIVTLPAVQEFRDDMTIDVHRLLRILYSQAGTITLEQLTDRYIESLAESASMAASDELMDAIMGVLIMSQAGSPVRSVTDHPMAWRSRSIVPRAQLLDDVLATDDVIAHQLYLSAQMNPDMSIWDHYDSLVEPGMTSAQGRELQQRVSAALLALIRAHAVYVNVPSSMYNQ